jgi:hypothetical protein
MSDIHPDPSASAVTPLLNADSQIESLAAQLLLLKSEFCPVSTLEFNRSLRKTSAWLDNPENTTIAYPSCPCWVDPETPLCKPECPYQTAVLYTRRCECITNVGNQLSAVQCHKCLQDYHCKTIVIDAAFLKCTCLPVFPILRDGAKRARDCEKCIQKVKNLLVKRFATPPACICKNVYSTDLFKCRPECNYQISSLYQIWFPNRKPCLYIWQNHSRDAKMLLPVCKCWIPHVSMTCHSGCPDP